MVIVNQGEGRPKIHRPRLGKAQGVERGCGVSIGPIVMRITRGGALTRQKWVDIDRHGKIERETRGKKEKKTGGQ